MRNKKVQIFAISTAVTLFVVMIAAIMLGGVFLPNKGGDINASVGSDTYFGTVKTANNYGSVVDKITDANADPSWTKITSSAELTAFFASESIYGYLANDIPDWNSGIGSNIIFNNGRTFDGNGFMITATNNSTNWQKTNVVQANLGEHDTYIKASGVFIAWNKGEVKNLNFTYSGSLKMVGGTSETTGAGIISGVNDGLIRNTFLNITGDYAIHLEPGGTTYNTHTISIGGFAGINRGIIENISVNIAAKGSELNLNALSKRSSGDGGIRALAGGVAGMMYTRTSAIRNVYVSGNGVIKSTTRRTNKGTDTDVGGIRRSAGVVAAMSEESCADTATEFGVIDGVVYSYTGRIVTSNMRKTGWNSQEKENDDNLPTKMGIFGCVDNAVNVFVTFETTKEPMTCGCDGLNEKTQHHNSNQNYSRVFSTNPEINLTFSFADDGQINLAGNLVDESNGRIIWKAIFTSIKKGAESTASEISYTDRVSSYDLSFDRPSDGLTNTRPNGANGGTDTALLYQASKGRLNVGEMQAGYLGKIGYTTQENGVDKQYDGNVVLPYTVTLADGQAVQNTVSSTKVHIDRNGAISQDIKYVGDYLAKLIADDDGFCYVDEATRVAVDFVEGAELPFTQKISLANISSLTNESTWFKNYQVNIGIAGAPSAIDTFEYSTDGGTVWKKVVGLNYAIDKSTAQAGRIYKFRAYSGTELVTEVTAGWNIKVDNTLPVFESATFTQDGNVYDASVWTNKDFAINFGANDINSGLASVTANGQALTAVGGVYSYNLTENINYDFTLTDIAGNVATKSVVAKIDKITPQAEINANGYLAGSTANDKVTFTISVTVGASEGKLEYKLGDAEWREIPLSAGASSYTLVLENNTGIEGKELQFRVTNGAGIESIQNFGKVIIDRATTTIAITDDNIVIEGELTKEYDGTTNFSGTISLINLADHANVVNNLVISAVYDSKNAGSDRKLIISVSATADFADIYKIEPSFNRERNAVITKKGLSVAVENASKIFGSENPTINFTTEGLIAGDIIDIKLTTVADKSSNVGIYGIVIDTTAVYENYTINNATNGELRVDTKKVNIIILGHTGLVYNGEAREIKGYYEDVNASNKDVVISYVDGVTPINAGVYKASLSIEDTNYEADSKTIEFTIAKASPKIVASDANKVYDGSEKSLEATLDKQGKAIRDSSLTYKYNSLSTLPVNAGTYSVMIIFAGDENYNRVSETAVLVIEKAEYAARFDNLSVTFNASPQSVEVVNAPAGTTIKYTNNAKIYAGTYTVKAKLSNSNYNDKEYTAVLTIAKAKIDGIEFNDQTQKFNGNVFSIEPENIPSGMIAKYKNGNQASNVGRHEVVLMVSDPNRNYEDYTKTAYLIISKGDITGVSFPKLEFMYDGNEHTILASNLPSGAKVVYDNNVLDTAGYHTVTVSVDAGENYNVLVINCEVRIKPIEVEIMFRNTTGYKVGDDILLEAYYIDIFGEESSADLVFDKDAYVAELGKYTVKATITDDNYVVKGGVDPVINFEVAKAFPMGIVIGCAVGGGVVLLGGAIATIIIVKKRKKVKIV